MTAPSEQQHATALLSMLTTGNVPVFEVDAIKSMGTPPQKYAEFELEWRPGAVSRANAQQTANGYRFTTYYIADNVANARNVLRLVEAAVRGKRVTVAGRVSTPIQRESADPIDEVNGRYSGWTTWTYVL